MNISFFLKPKVDVFYIRDDCPVRQALDELLKSGFTAVPVISDKGKYVGTITEGDFLRLLLRCAPEEIDRMTVAQVARRVRHRSVNIDARMEDMVDLVAVQNFVPVTDGRGMFCGIITRRDVINQLRSSCDKAKRET